MIRKYYVNTTEKEPVVSVTNEIKYAIRDSEATGGLVTITLPKWGAAVVIMPSIPEAMSGLVHYLNTQIQIEEGQESVTDFIKRNISLKALLASSALGRSLSISFGDEKLFLDPYDDICIVSFESEMQRREIIVHILPDPALTSKENPDKEPTKR